MDLMLPEKLRGSEELIRGIMVIAEKYYRENDSAHDFDHALRVTRLALHLGEEEGGDLEVLALAGILHDTARREQQLTGVCHAARGAEIAKEILNEVGYDKAKRKQIEAMIRTHRFRKGDQPETLEAKILFDADKLDAIGAIGIGRAYAISGLHGQRLYSVADVLPDEDSKEYSPVAEFEFKLRKIVERMLTESGRKLAVRRHEFMVSFFAELRDEVEGRI